MPLDSKSNELVGLCAIPAPGVISDREGGLLGNELVGGFELENEFALGCDVSIAADVVGGPPVTVPLL